MKLNIKTLLISLSFLLGACGGTSQDPLEKQSESVKNGVPPSGFEKPVYIPPAADVLRIDGPDRVFMQEGQEYDITFTGRTLFIEDTQYQIELANQSDFAGMTSQSTPGDTAEKTQGALQIKWKVPSGLTTGAITELKLMVRMFTTNTTPSYSLDKEVTLAISNNNNNVPEITKIEVPTTAVREGTGAIMKVYVKDMDSTTTRRPSLMVVSDGGTNVSAYMTVPTNVPNANNVFSSTNVVNPIPLAGSPNEWVFDVLIDLRNAEITANRATARFALYAMNDLKKLSGKTSGSLDVWTSVSQPVSSWTGAINFKRNQPNSYTFTVTDPKGEGTISARFTTNCSRLEGTATCDCRQVPGVTGKANGAAQCTINWTPPSGTGFFFSSSAQTISVEVTNKSPVNADTEEKVQTFNGIINVVN